MSKNTGTSELINYFTLGANGAVSIGGNLTLSTIVGATVDTDTFLVSDNGVIKFRTGTQFLADIGAQASGSYQAALSGTGFVKISGTTISYDNSTYLTTSSASSTYQPLLTNPVTGTGTTNFLPKFTGTSTVGNSIISEVSGAINVSGLLTATGGLRTTGANGYQDTDGTNTIVVNANFTSNISGIGTLTNNNLAFVTNSTIKATLNASGNLGLGVTPSAWSILVPAIQIGDRGGYVAAQNGNNVLRFGSNNYFNGSNFIYTTTDKASYFETGSGEYRWFQAPSGNAGTSITFSQPMTLFNSGNLAVGLTTDAGFKLDVSGTGRFSGNVTVNNTITAAQSGADVAAIIATSGWSGGSNNRIITFGRVALAVAGEMGYDDPNTRLYIGTTTAHAFAVRTSNVDRLVIASTGAATFSSSVQTGSFINVVTSNPDANLTEVFRTQITGLIGVSNWRNSIYASESTNPALSIFKFSLADSQTTQRDVMTLNGAGNVLIGTTTDSGFKLDVNGNTRSNDVIIGIDVTYGNPYRTVAFGTTGDGNNRILASTNNSDGMYFMAATGRGFNFRPNGGTANLVTISSTGAATFSSSVTAASGINAIGQEQAFSWQRTTGTPSDVYALNADSASAYLENNTTSNILMTWAEGGNVGIGTATPAAGLHVETDANAATEILRVININAGSSATSRISLGNNASIGATTIIQYSSTHSEKPNTLEIGTQVNGNIDFITSGLDRMRITSAGNVGIGFSAPKSKTHVLGVEGGIFDGQASSTYTGGGQPAVSYYYGDAFGNGAPYGTSAGGYATYSVWRGGGSGGYFQGGSGDPSPGGGGAGIVAIGGAGSTYAGDSKRAEGGAGIFARGGLNGDGSTRTWAGYFDGKLGIQTTGADGIVLEPDLGSANNSGRLFFKTSGQTFNIFNNSSDLRITFDAIPGNTSGTSLARFTNTGKYFRMEANTGGIQFNGDTAAANALDDYEEGTWTPVVADQSGGGNAATLSADSQGVYTKIGRVVYFRFSVILTSKASMTAGNEVFVQGFPFTSQTIPGNWYNPFPTIIRNITFTGYVQFHQNSNSTYGYFRENVSNAAGDNIIVSDITDSAAMQVSGFYFI